jgi:hypothetical protein
MNAPISTITHVTEPKRWRAPEFTQPIVVKPSALKALGEIRGYRWFRVAQYDAEWAERPVRLTDDDTLPDGVLCQYDEHGERSYARLDPFAPGSFQKFLTEPPPPFGPPAPAPLRFADALPPMYAPRPRVQVPQRLGGSRSGIMDGSVAPLVHAPKVRVYGAAAILADLARRGIVVTLGTDRASLSVQVRGKLMGDDRQMLRDAAPLLLAHLRGESLLCTAGPHAKGQDAAAVTVGPLGAPICTAHLAERV